MKRPLLISDCDEVLLHMVVPFRDWLDEAHHIHFDFAHSSFAEALRHKHSGDVVEQALIWQLLKEFFVTEMHRQSPIAGAVEAITRISQHADVVILTNIGQEGHAGRTAQLAEAGMPFEVICNQGGKGRPLAGLVARYDPSVTVFVDDLQHNHDSVARHAPEVWRLHMVGEPEMAPHVTTSPDAHARIDTWAQAEAWVMDHFAKGPADAVRA